MDAALERDVRRRAKESCEYCQIAQAFYRQRFPIDHIIARQHGGLTAADNLALCCPSCNRFKGPNIAGIDPTTGEMAGLFNPRRDPWNEHFEWHGPKLLGLTPIGRATVAVLNMNHSRYVTVRKALIAEGVFPPLR